MFGHALTDVTIQHFVGDFTGRKHEGQSEGRRFRDQTGKVVQTGHFNVDNAGARTVDHLRIIAQLALRKYVDLQRAVGAGFNLLFEKQRQRLLQI